jgi:hypothetical protein
MVFRSCLGLVASLLLLFTGCKAPGASTAGSALYTFDSTTNQVFIWTDMDTLYANPANPPTYQITASLFSQVTNLAWGGVCFDIKRGILYLVSDTGSIVRVNSIRSQTGTVPSAQVVSYSLSSTGRLTNGVFGQTSLDSQNDTLYITENGGSNTQIWVVTGASTQAQSATVALQSLQVSGDSGGTGVAAASGTVYAFVLNGGPVGLDAWTGPRLRQGTSSSFPSDGSKVIIGTNTGLGLYGSLAIDSGDGYLFSARHNTDSGVLGQPIQVFTTGQFNSGINATPYQTLGSATDQPNLRVISHPGNKDWLVGLLGEGTTGYSTILLWRSPMGGSAAVSLTGVPTGSVLKGLAVDGNAS